MQTNLSCPDADSFDTAAPMATYSSTLREGLRIKACNQLSLNDTTLRSAISTALGRTDLTFIATRPRPTTSDVQAVYQLFYPGRSALPSTVVDSSLAVSNKVSTNSSTLDPWRSLILTFCYAPDWQAP